MYTHSPETNNLQFAAFQVGVIPKKETCFRCELFVSGRVQNHFFGKRWHQWPKWLVHTICRKRANKTTCFKQSSGPPAKYLPLSTLDLNFPSALTMTDGWLFFTLRKCDHLICSCHSIWKVTIQSSSKIISLHTVHNKPWWVFKPLNFWGFSSRFQVWGFWASGSIAVPLKLDNLDVIEVEFKSESIGIQFDFHSFTGCWDLMTSDTKNQAPQVLTDAQNGFMTRYRLVLTPKPCPTCRVRLVAVSARLCSYFRICLTRSTMVSCNKTWEICMVTSWASISTIDSPDNPEMTTSGFWSPWKECHAFESLKPQNHLAFRSCNEKTKSPPSLFCFPPWGLPLPSLLCEWDVKRETG